MPPTMTAPQDSPADPGRPPGDGSPGAPGAAHGRALRFFAACLALLGAAEAVQGLLIERMGLPTVLGIAGGMAVYSGAGYAVNRLWVFRGLPDRPDGDD